MSIPIYGNGKIVGNVKGFVFWKNLNSQKHFLHRPPAIAFDPKSLDEAKKAGADRVCIKDELNKLYIAFIETIVLKGIMVNRGNGDQIALPLQHFRPSAVEAKTLLDDLKAPKPEPVKIPKQVEMF